MCFVATASDSKEPSLCSIPREVVLYCLLRVPRSYHLNVSCVSRNLRSLVRSPEFNRLLSLRKDSVYVSFVGATQHWFTLRPIEKMKKIEYRLVPVPIPISLFRSPATSVAVGSEIYFVGGLYRGPSSDLWIFDTRSGKLTQGPSRKVARAGNYTVGVVDGKIYVIGGEIQVEVFDPKSRSWNFQGEEKFDCSWRFTASLEGKVYMLKSGGAEISAYNPNAREGRREEIITRKEKKRKREEGDLVQCVCVVENVLYACFAWSGLMWFDTKLKVWTRLVRRDGKALYPFSVAAMAEYNGKLAVLWPQRKIDGSELVALDRVRQEIRGKVEWSGIVATIPNDYSLLHCLTVSD